MLGPPAEVALGGLVKRLNIPAGLDDDDGDDDEVGCCDHLSCSCGAPSPHSFTTNCLRSSIGAVLTGCFVDLLFNITQVKKDKQRASIQHGNRLLYAHLQLPSRYRSCGWFTFTKDSRLHIYICFSHVGDASSGNVSTPLGTHNSSRTWHLSWCGWLGTSHRYAHSPLPDVFGSYWVAQKPLAQAPCHVLSHLLLEGLSHRLVLACCCWAGHVPLLSWTHAQRLCMVLAGLSFPRLRRPS
jgi:hypothetical protein